MTQISIFNQQKDLKIPSKDVKNLFNTLISFKKLSIQELEVHFITDKAMKARHQEIFSDPTSTDCITCPIDDPYDKTNPYCVLGSCFICPKTAINYAQAHEKDPYLELSLYCVHCFLHLIGYDDIDPKERKKMRNQEKICMNHLIEKKATLNNN
jgi:probable rRNA maturation factor